LSFQLERIALDLSVSPLQTVRSSVKIRDDFQTEKFLYRQSSVRRKRARRNVFRAAGQSLRQPAQSAFVIYLTNAARTSRIK
jgi:hypothetical protein